MTAAELCALADDADARAVVLAQRAIGNHTDQPAAKAEMALTWFRLADMLRGRAAAIGQRA